MKNEENNEKDKKYGKTTGWYVKYSEKMAYKKK